MSSSIPVKAYKEEKDISYYEPEFVGSGNLGYRQERCLLDIYYPMHCHNFVTVVWFHGGGLQCGEKGIPEILKNRDIAVVAPNYRLSSDQARCPDYLEDAAAAVAWVMRNITRYGGDPTKVYLSGGSGGGYLAAMIGLDKRYLARHGISNLQLSGVMPVSGQMTTHFQIVNERKGIIAIGANPVPVIDEYAPLHYILRDVPPMTLFVGDPAIEWPGRPEENMLLAALLTRIAGHPDVSCVSLKGFDHGDVYDPSCLLLYKKIQEQEMKKIIARGPVCPPLEIRKTTAAQEGKSLPSAAWERAAWVTLTDRQGLKTVPATRAAMLYDEQNLYFSVICDEPTPDKLVQTVSGHDATGMWDGDCVDIYLLPVPQELGKVIQFIVAPDGSFCDIDAGMFGNLGLQWNPAGIATRCCVNADNWTVELTVPFSSIGVVPSAEGIAGNIYRRRRADGDDRYSNWAPTTIERNLFPEVFGKMVFAATEN